MLAVTGVIAFVKPFSLGVVGLHTLMGFVFIVLVVLHVVNNIRPLKGYLHSRALWVTLFLTGVLAALFFLQPEPVKSLLGLSGNLGPAMERFEMREDGIVFHYSPSGEYKMKLTVKAGPAYNAERPPQVAIWLENQGGYHIKTLLTPAPEDAASLPYWTFKRAGWEKAKREADEQGGVDVVSSPTPNGSFDPADYILPVKREDSTPYRLLIEVNQPGDAHGSHSDQPSLVHVVEIDNLDPKTFQLLDLVGYPKREDKDGKEAWSLYYVDENFGSALDLIDSALLEIERGKQQSDPVK